MPNRCLAGCAFSVSDFRFIYVNPENAINLNDVTVDELRKNGITFQIDISLVDENLNFIDNVGNIGLYSEELHVFSNAGTFTLKVSGFVGGLEFFEHRTVTITKEPDTPIVGNELQVFLDVLDIDIQEFERLASNLSPSSRITLTSQIIKLLGDVYSGILMGRYVEWFPDGNGRYGDDYFEYSCLEEISENMKFVKTYYFSHRQGNDGMQNPSDLSDFVKAITALKNGWIQIERGENIIVKNFMGIIIDDCVPYYALSGNILCMGAFIDDDLQIENSGSTEFAFSEDCRFYSNYWSSAISEEDLFDRFNRILPQSKRADAKEIVLATESEIPSYESLPPLSYRVDQIWSEACGHWIATLYKIYIKNNKRNTIELNCTSYHFTGFNELHNYTLFKGNEMRTDVRIPRIPIDVIALGTLSLDISNCIITGDFTEEIFLQNVHFDNVVFEGNVSGIDMDEKYGAILSRGVVWFKSKPVRFMNASLLKISCPKEILKEFLEEKKQWGYGFFFYDAIDLTDYDINDIYEIFGNCLNQKLNGNYTITHLKSSDKDYAKHFIQQHNSTFSKLSTFPFYKYDYIFCGYLGYGASDVYINGKRDSFKSWFNALPIDECEDNWDAVGDGSYYVTTERNVKAILNAYETGETNFDGYYIDRNNSNFCYQIPYEYLLEEWEHYGNFGMFKKGVDKKEFYKELVDLYEYENEYLNYDQVPTIRCVYEEVKRRAGL
ncbi:MAG: hypothetical protein HDR33_08560 [Treponema sp.]|nr:hypothetical protein [Treponema sp.]